MELGSRSDLNYGYKPIFIKIRNYPGHLIGAEHGIYSGTSKIS